MEKNKQFDERYLAFGADILNLVSHLPRTPATRHVADQLFRSGTSVGAHLQEARAAESRADFIHKFQIALKEMRETSYWLALLKRSGLAKEVAMEPLMAQCGELTAILAKSVITAKRNAGISTATTTDQN